MLLALLVCSLVLVSAVGQQVNDDWVDPHDMLHYDSTTKSMRKPTEVRCCLSGCTCQPTCDQVFKRFLNRLLKEMQKVGLPTDSSDAFYDAKVGVSKEAITEIQTLVDGDGSFTTGALDTAVSQILVDLKPHDCEAWKWRFKDSFGVELDTLLKIGLCVLVMMAIICTQLRSTVSWMLLALLVCGLVLVSAVGQQANDDWVDPYDMLHYDSTSKNMRKPTEIEEQKKKISLLSGQPTCNPVFKRFLKRLLKEMQKVGLPTDSSEAFYDAKVGVSKQAITEIQTLLDGDGSFTTGALDTAVSQILVDLKPHEYDACKGRLKDSFGVDLCTLLMIGLCALVMMLIICTRQWSTVSWFVLFTGLFAVCFAVSIVWNWFYLYKIALAEHHHNLVKMDSVREKCTGMKKIDWADSLKEWYRSTWTLQDDPCKIYYNLLFVDPLLLVPPTKAISFTITTFITEPMKHIGQGISEFFRALLQDLPVTLQIPVLLIIVLVVVVFVFVSVQAAFLHGITAPLRHWGPPPPGLQQPQQQPQALFQGVADLDPLAGRDTHQQGPRQQADDGRAHRNPVRQRHPNRPIEKKARVVVETLQSAARSEDETDNEQQEGNCEVEQNLTEESDAENQVENKEEPEEAADNRVAAHIAQAKTKTTPKAKPMRVSENRSQDQHSGDDEAPKSQPAGNPPSHTDVNGSS
ncbi:chloride channel CLIC-like protein 1 [Platichthys flesus]|uniref:chloride channel CLIC-like protein 1 n=1 Tax=Platichthys flesus TaxID=8260 RepID=UPI002DBB27B5|nr:chloride channel CLIC-like protein 1 [Platichthys flesus]